MVSSKRINIEIESLSVPGATVSDAQRLADALESELRARIAAGALGPGERPRNITIDAQSLEVPRGQRVESVARHLASQLLRISVDT